MGNSSSDKELLRTALLSILRDGLLQIRALGGNGDAELCAVEAEHLHNIPELIRTLDTGLLRYYYEAERPAYKGHVKNTPMFEPHWSQIESYLNRSERPKWKSWWKGKLRGI